MSGLKKFFCLLSIAAVIAVSAVLAMHMPVSAATCSDGVKTRTITVQTKANYAIPGSESITLRQTKGVCKKESRSITGKVKTKTSKQYGTWKIVAKATDQSSTVKKSLTGSRVKLKLKPNKTYEVTVSWDSGAAAFKTLDKGNYTSYPTWEVESVWKVSEYY